MCQSLEDVYSAKYVSDGDYQCLTKDTRYGGWQDSNLNLFSHRVKLQPLRPHHRKPRTDWYLSQQNSHQRTFRSWFVKQTCTFAYTSQEKISGRFVWLYLQGRNSAMYAYWFSVFISCQLQAVTIVNYVCVKSYHRFQERFAWYHFYIQIKKASLIHETLMRSATSSNLPTVGIPVLRILVKCMQEFAWR